ncbi:MAG: hypothetical protein ABSC90_07915 [Acidimicrobiales bacterium]|jgi:hypothetical protein
MDMHSETIHAERITLEEKLSLLAMERNYWRQRCLEQADARRAAEAERARLEERIIHEDPDGLVSLSGRRRALTSTGGR